MQRHVLSLVWAALTACPSLSHSYEQYVISSSIIFAIVAWSSFFISRAAAPARVSLSVILFLVISSQTNSQLSDLPKGTSGVWLLDFLTVTKMFVFYSMVEYVMCNFLMRVEARVEKARVAATKRRAEGSSTARTSDSPVATKGVTVQVVDEESGASNAPTASLQEEVARNASGVTRMIPALVTKDGELRCRDQHLEILSRIAFPIAYAITLAVFFSTRY